jgi:hypothetical protein
MFRNNGIVNENSAMMIKNKQNGELYDYTTYRGKYKNNNECRIKFGQFGGNQVSNYNGNQVDLENQLFGINTPLSKCMYNNKGQRPFTTPG